EKLDEVASHFHVVNPDDVRLVLEGKSDVRRHPVELLSPRDGNEQRPPQLLEVTRIHDHLELHPGVRLIVYAVVEVQAGVEDHVLDPLATQLIEQTRETRRGALRLVRSDLHRADVMRVCAFDVDRHGGDTGVGDDTTHLRVGEATGVVDDHGTRADGGSG